MCNFLFLTVVKADLLFSEGKVTFITIAVAVGSLARGIRFQLCLGKMISGDCFPTEVQGGEF